jgi:serine phosphatase RsbU (regulator of sigma subunit)
VQWVEWRGAIIAAVATTPEEVDGGSPIRHRAPGTVLVAIVASALALVAVVAVVAIVRTYDDDRREAVDERARLAFESVADSSQYLNGRLDVLTTFATRPSFTDGDGTAVERDLASFPAEALALDGGVAWFGLDGDRLASSIPTEQPTSPAVADVVERALADERAISSALRSPEFLDDVVVLAVATRAADGSPNGVLAAGLPVAWLQAVAAALDESRGATSFIYDRAGSLLVGPVEPGSAAPRPAVESFEDLDERGPVVFTGRPGATDPAGTTDRVIGYALERALTGWTVLQVDPESEAFAAARDSLRRTVIALVAGVAALLAAAVAVGRRLNRLSRRAAAAESDAAIERERAREEEANLRLALEATETGWFQWHAGSAELEWSAGTDATEAPVDVPRSVADALAIVHPDEREAVRARLDRAVADGRPVELEFRLATPWNGEDVQWVWLHVAPLLTGAAGATRMVGLVRDATERRRAQEARAHAAAREREVARTLQRSLLPERVPAVAGLRVVARYRSAGPDTVVGGDFYDVTELADGSHAIVIGDVCGHGIEAASATSLARHTLRAAARHTDDPAVDLQWLHDALGTDSHHGFVTCAAARGRVGDGGDGSTYVLDLALGGHPPPVLLRDGRARFVGEPGTLLGVVEPQLRTTRHVLARGDRLVLYTDGLTDSSRPRLGDAELLALVEELASLHLDDFADVLLRRSEPAEGIQHDDTALVAVDVVA